MQVTFTPIFGMPQPVSWVEFVSDAGGKSFFLLSVAGETAEQSREQCRQIVTQTVISSSLDLHQVCSQIVQLTESTGLQLELVAGFFDFAGHQCSLCSLQGKALLKRAQKVGQIVAATDQLQIIEGKLQLDDTFIFVLNSASQILPLLEKSLPRLKKFAFLEDEVAGEVRTAAVGLNQPALVSLEIVEGDQAEPPVTAGKVLAVGEQLGGVGQNLGQPTDVDMSVQPNISAAITRSAPAMLGGVATILTSIKQFVLSLVAKDVFVRRHASVQLFKLLVPVVLILSVGVGVVVFQNRQQKAQIIQAQLFIQPIELQLTQIQQTVSTNPVAARQQTETLISQLDGKMKQTGSQKTTMAMLQAELTKVKNYYITISGLDQYPALQTFYDLRLVKSDFLANRMDLQDNTLIFLDSGQGKVIALDTISKKWTDIPVGSAAEMKDIELLGQNAYVLGNGLYQLNLANTADQKLLRPNDDLLQNATGMRLYQTYLYVLSVAQNNIFRYSPDPTKKDVLADPIGWLHQPVTLDLNQLQSFAIDGDVWLGLKTGEVKKFTSGVASDFTMTGLQEPFTTPVTIFTKADLNNLYVLEPAKERLVVISKAGQFIREIKSPTLSTTTNLVANEKTKQAFVVSGSLVFEIQL